MSTHCRNIILSKRAIMPAPIPPSPPGEVVDLKVTTPQRPDSNIATGTWFSPEGAAIGSLDYVTQLTGGPGMVEIVSIVPVP